MRYQIVSASSERDLELLVENLIFKYWKPIGGAFYSAEHGKFYQTMIQE